VVDEAGILSSETKNLLALNAELTEKNTGHQAVIVTVRSLHGQTIEDFTRTLGNEWGIGAAGKNDGIILLVATQDKKVRIEVGAGLKPIITDAVSHKIIADMVAAFEDGEFEEGISDGALKIFRVLEGKEADLNILEYVFYMLIGLLCLPIYFIGRYFGFFFSDDKDFSGAGGSFSGEGVTGSWGGGDFGGADD
jgi:uncharacterized protein